MSKKATYGIDAPGVIFRLATVGAACIVAGVLSWQYAPATLRFLTISFLSPGVCLMATAAFMLVSSTRLKFGLCGHVVRALELEGDERVLDIGCGRGLALLMVARQLSTGMAVGIDIWSSTDLSANTPDAVLHNAELEGVVDRIDIQTADARALPFPDQTFDAVVSISALHNLPTAKDREKALDEIIRVLRPGGCVSIFDIFHATSYAKYFRHRGVQITTSGLLLLWLVPGQRIWGRRDI